MNYLEVLDKEIKEARKKGGASLIGLLQAKDLYAVKTDVPTIKERILNVKTEAVIHAVNMWAFDNKLKIDGAIKHPLENYIKTVIVEME